MSAVGCESVQREKKKEICSQLTQLKNQIEQNKLFYFSFFHYFLFIFCPYISFQLTPETVIDKVNGKEYKLENKENTRFEK